MEKLNDSLRLIFRYFSTAQIETIIPLTSGHINTTYHVITTDGDYVLQKMNSQVFSNPIATIENKVKASNHLHRLPKTETIQYVMFLKTTAGDTFLKYKQQYWCLQRYFKNSRVYDVVNSSSIAFEAGRLYSDFLYKMSFAIAVDYKASIPNFHSLSYRKEQYEIALKNSNTRLLLVTKQEQDFIFEQLSGLFNFEAAMLAKTLPVRITHNDTKLSNVLFDPNGIGTAVIDYDTIMPGCIAFDFGDAVRTICSTSAEDDNNFNDVRFNLDYFEYFTKGFSVHLKSHISDAEIDSLIEGVKLMPFIMGLRFLTDYLNGNRYFKVHYKTHNLDRARNQFALYAHILERTDAIQNIIDNVFYKNDK